MQDSKGVLAVGLRRSVQQDEVNIVFTNWGTGELQTVQSKRVTFEHAGQMPAWSRSSMRTRLPRSASSAPSCQTVVDRPTPPFGCSTARTTGVAFRFAERPDAATLGSTIVVTPTLLLTLRSAEEHM